MSARCTFGCDGTIVASGVDQLFPSLPVANADLRDEEAIVRDSFSRRNARASHFADRTARRPYRRRPPRPFRRQPSAGDDHFLDLLADRDDAIDPLRAVLAAIPDVERKRDAAIDDERADRLRARRRQRKRMRDPFVHVDDVGPLVADEPAQRRACCDVELVPHRQTGEFDAALLRFRREHRIGPADDRDVVSTLAQTGRRLKHLMDRTGVELVELEDLKNPHGGRGRHCAGEDDTRASRLAPKMKYRSVTLTQPLI